MYIVGIDIAKRKHEAAVIDGEGAVIIKPFSFTNNCSGYNRLLAMLTKAKLPLDEVSFAMEATGHYWLALLPDFRRRASVFRSSTRCRPTPFAASTSVRPKQIRGTPCSSRR